jgi:hypothetical protein
VVQDLQYGDHVVLIGADIVRLVLEEGYDFYEVEKELKKQGAGAAVLWDALEFLFRCYKGIDHQYEVAHKMYNEVVQQLNDDALCQHCLEPKVHCRCMEIEKELAEARDQGVL